MHFKLGETLEKFKIYPSHYLALRRRGIIPGPHVRGIITTEQVRALADHFNRVRGDVPAAVHEMLDGKEAA